MVNAANANTADTVQNIAVIGSGTMGRQIGMDAAVAGSRIRFTTDLADAVGQADLVI